MRYYSSPNKRLAGLISFFGFLLWQCTNAPLQREIELRNFYAYPGNVDHNTAIYGEIINHSSRSDTLLSVHSPSIQLLEIHQTIVTNNGIAQMQPVTNGIPLAPNSQFVLKPGSYHIMGIGLLHSLQIGDSLTLHLAFAQSPPQTIRLPIRWDKP